MYVVLTNLSYETTYYCGALFRVLLGLVSLLCCSSALLFSVLCSAAALLLSVLVSLCCLLCSVCVVRFLIYGVYYQHTHNRILCAPSAVDFESVFYYISNIYSIYILF